MTKTLLSILFVFSMIAHAGPTFVGSGAGESEYALSFTRQNLSWLLSLCENQACSLSPRGEQTWKELLSRSDQKPKAIFKPALNNHILFALHPETNEVWFAQDQLWQDAQKTQPLDEISALQIWIDILGASAPSMNPQDLQEIKSKLSDLLTAQVSRSILHADAQNTFNILLFSGRTVQDQVFIRDPHNNSFEITSALAAVANCMNGYSPSTPHYAAAQWQRAVATQSSRISLQIDIIQKYNCGSQAVRSRLLVLLPASVQNQKYKIDIKAMRIYEQGQ